MVFLILKELKRDDKDVPYTETRDQVKQLKNKEWRLTQIPQVEGAIVALNPKNGAVLALDGGFNYELSSFNRVTQAERQPGSNFKPFIYSAALNKEFTLASMINDAPIVMNDTGENELWRPVNDTKKFYGPTSLREALTKSRNLVSIRLLQAIGINYALDYVKRFGFDPNTLPRALSLALGSGTVTPMQIANGYSVFANGGSRVDPYFIDRIEDQLHHVLFQSKPLMACSVCIVNPNPPENELPSPMAPRVITPQNAYLITQVLRDVIRAGTGKRARTLNRSDIAGKTGTTNDQVDAWFSGFNSNLEATVWVGFDNMKPLREYGARAALPIWMEFMEAALNHTPEATMPEPAGLVMVRIDPSTGLLAKPTEANARFEIFEKSNAPTTFSPNENGESVYSGTAGSNKKTDNSDSHSDPSDLF